jgi:hypothetical protein
MTLLKNRNQLTREEINQRKEQFPTGTRLRLIRFAKFAGDKHDDNLNVPSGTEGEVLFVDDGGTIHVAWDNNRNLGVLVEDEIEMIGKVKE